MMRKLIGAIALLTVLWAPLFGEVRVGGLITPKSVSDKVGPLGQALFVSVGSKANRFEVLSDLSLLKEDNADAGARHTENTFSVLAGYRHTFLIDAVNPSLTFRTGYQRQVIDDQQTFLGNRFGTRLVNDGLIGMIGAGVEYRLHKRVMLGVEAGLWGLLKGTKDANWEVGIQFPMITASYSLF